MVRRSERARRSRLTVTESGEVVVVLPRRAPLSEAEQLVARHAGWLDRQTRRQREEQSRLLARPPLGQGRGLVVAGVPLRVTTVDGPSVRPSRGRVEVLPGSLVLRLGADGRAAAALLDAWLRREARTAVGERVAVRAAEMAVAPGRVSIRDQSSRWASASPGGSLSFSWRLVLAPPWVLDAVVVHELAHLRVRGHTSPFWSLVTRHAPRTPEARAWLRSHARELRAALQ
jgi:hypothetical protein